MHTTHMAGLISRGLNVLHRFIVDCKHAPYDLSQCRVLLKETMEKARVASNASARGARCTSPLSYIGWDSPVRKARREVTTSNLLLDYGFLMGSRIIMRL
jgi:hypothetical protein